MSNIHSFFFFLQDFMIFFVICDHKWGVIGFKNAKMSLFTLGQCDEPTIEAFVITN